MEKEPRFDEMPFRAIKKEVVGQGSCVNVQEFCERNDLIVKSVLKYYNGSPEEEAKVVADYVNLAREKFPDQYSLFFPKTQVVIGKNEFDKKAIYVVQEKIIGYDLAQGALPEESKQDFKELLSFLIDLYAQTFNKGWGLSAEIFRTSNYMLGHKEAENNDQDRIYIVDMTPIFRISLGTFKLELDRLASGLGLSLEYKNELLAKLDVLKEK